MYCFICDGPFFEKSRLLYVPRFAEQDTLVDPNYRFQLVFPADGVSCRRRRKTRENDGKPRQWWEQTDATVNFVVALFLRISAS